VHPALPHERPAQDVDAEAEQVLVGELVRGLDRVARDVERAGERIEDRELGGAGLAVDERLEEAAMDDALAKRLRHPGGRELLGIDGRDGVEVDVGLQDVTLDGVGEAPLEIVDLAVGGGDRLERAKSEPGDLGRRREDLHATSRTEAPPTRKPNEERPITSPGRPSRTSAARRARPAPSAPSPAP